MPSFFDAVGSRSGCTLYIILTFLLFWMTEAHGLEASSSVPVVLGDYCNAGARKSNNQTDIPKLISALKRINAQDYMHLVWNEETYPQGWADFQAMAPEFQKANINLWLYLTPPSEGPPDPFGGDYIKWAIECAKIAKAFPAVKGIVIDDFNANVATFTPKYCKTMMTEARKVAPLSLMVVSYFGRAKSITKHVEQGAIDGVIFPYLSAPLNHHDTGQLHTQIVSYRTELDRISKKLKVHKKLPLIVMVYATKHSRSVDSPTPTYVKECLKIALSATEMGIANGAVTYCLPKDQDEFLNSVAEAFNTLK